MNFLEPDQNLGVWLKATLNDLVERTKQGDEAAYETLKDGINVLVYAAEPGYIEEHFGEWILAYNTLLKQYKNNPDNFVVTQHNTDQKEPEE
jgi:hypothetical protein